MQLTNPWTHLSIDSYPAASCNSQCYLLKFGLLLTQLLAPSARVAACRYCTLHKLVVQQCPRSSVASLMWSLEAAGFASVKLSTTLETYLVGANSYPGYKSILTFEL